MKMNLNRMRDGLKKWLVFGIAAVSLFTGCAGHRPAVIQTRAPSSEEIWDIWSAHYRSVLSMAIKGETPAQRSQALERLVEVAQRAPSSQARALVVRDACVLSAAEGAAVVLERLECESGVLRGLIGGD